MFPPAWHGPRAYGPTLESAPAIGKGMTFRRWYNADSNQTTTRHLTTTTTPGQSIRTTTHASFQHPRAVESMGATATKTLFVTLIRTHHVTSRKKLQRVRKAAARFGVPFVLVRYGGSPGLMYAEGGDGPALGAWVGAVKDLRYKDFQCVWKPEARELRDGDGPAAMTPPMPAGGFNETESVASFGQVMERKGLGEWFRIGLLSKRAGQFDGEG